LSTSAAARRVIPSRRRRRPETHARVASATAAGRENQASPSAASPTEPRRSPMARSSEAQSDVAHAEQATGPTVDSLASARRPLWPIVNLTLIDLQELRRQRRDSAPLDDSPAYLNAGPLSTSCVGVRVTGCSLRGRPGLSGSATLAVGSVTRWFIGRSGGATPAARSLEDRHGDRVGASRAWGAGRKSDISDGWA
jgi:hypothetical protein